VNPKKGDDGITQVKRVIRDMRSGVDREEAITRLEEAVAALLEKRGHTPEEPTEVEPATTPA
jgi:signal transduction histidine kinase